MKHRLPCLIGLVLALATCLPTGATAATYAVRQQVIGGGAVNLGTSTFRTRGTIGQAPAGWFANTSYQHGVGFWYTMPRSGLSAVGGPPRAVPFRNRLDQNAPNPFNPRTTIRFSLARSGPVRLEVFDLRGYRVARLIDRDLSAGEHEVVFHPTELSSGIYVYRLQAGPFTQSRRITLIK